ncbi:hypothetical protein [Carboxylicivirga taeanensis]|uniref:hypothetical protein n=1 Tax=Carboxylicivirga taeanensis TaxID=1416875 RepID=UPI003F6DE1EB
MDDLSNMRGYLRGILVTLGLLLLGYILNPLLGTLKIVQLTWPHNLYFMALIGAIGLAVGIISDSNPVKILVSKTMLVPASLCIGVFGVLLFVQPQGYDSIVMNRLLETPVLFLSAFVFFAGGAYIGSNAGRWRHEWSGIMLVLTMLLFVFSTVVGQHDYYDLKMRIGTDRALFEAEDAAGVFYRLPFAVKLLSDDAQLEAGGDGAEETLVRVFNTVSDYKDVSLANGFQTKGWEVSLMDAAILNETTVELADVNLVFDRWIELKYISLVLLLISLAVKIKF